MKTLKKIYIPHKLTCLIIGVFVGACCSTATLAIEKNKSLFVFHSGLKPSDSTYLTSLLVELKHNISDRKIKTADINELSIAQLKKQLEGSNNCALTIGQPALEKILATRNKTPIFSTLVSRTNLDNLTNRYFRLGSRVTGIYQEQSFKRQLLLGRAINSDNKNIVVILGRKTRYFLDEYRTISQQQSLKLSFDILKHQESPQQSFTRLAEDDGFLIILNEEQQYSQQDLQSLLITSYKKHIPMIGSKTSDSKSAALASIYTPLKRLAKDTATGLQEMCDGKKLSKAKYSEHFAVLINPQIAAYLDYGHLDEKKLAKAVYALEQAEQKSATVKSISENSNSENNSYE